MCAGTIETMPRQSAFDHPKLWRKRAKRSHLFQQHNAADVSPRAASMLRKDIRVIVDRLVRQILNLSFVHWMTALQNVPAISVTSKEEVQPCLEEVAHLSYLVFSDEGTKNENRRTDEFFLTPRAAVCHTHNRVIQQRTLKLTKQHILS